MLIVSFKEKNDVRYQISFTTYIRIDSRSKVFMICGTACLGKDEEVFERET